MFYTDGAIGLGPGSSTRDVFLRRSAANTFMIDSNKSGGAADLIVTRNLVVNTGALATNATTGFLYVPTCPGTPTGTPTAFSGRAPIVINSTNNKLYFYSGGAWRDAGP
jgi:hypothetical protein